MVSFHDFAQAHGLLIRDLRDDGRIHRCPTADKPRSDNGAYMLERDRGWCQNWAQGDAVRWWNDASAKPWTPEEKAQADNRRRQQMRERTERASKAAATARAMLGEAELIVPRAATSWRPGRQAVEAIPAHPYLIAKGFPQESGLVRDGVLLIPMFDAGNYRQPIGLQRIAPDGSKLFLPGQRAKGAIHRLGSNQAREIWLVEGFATGLSVRAALKALYRTASVVVCFSAGNLTHIALMGIGTHVMADNDESGAGEQAAIATDLPYSMPVQRAWDANDVHRNQGIEAVKALVQERI